MRISHKFLIGYEVLFTACYSNWMLRYENSKEACLRSDVSTEGRASSEDFYKIK